MTMVSTDERGRQLAFDLARAPSYDPDDFLVSASNAEAHGLVDRWPDWPHRTLLLVGPPGCGKSHLAAIWAARAQARIVRTASDLAAVRHQSPVVALLEDMDRAGHNEADLFHLVNFASESGGWLVATARQPPDLWGLATRDLTSRLRLAALAPIGHPDPSLIRAVIVKLFADRQIMIAEDLVAYVALHCEQTLDGASRFVAAVDDEALASGRRITRLLAAQTLKRSLPAALGPDDY